MVCVVLDPVAGITYLGQRKLVSSLLVWMKRSPGDIKVHKFEGLGVEDRRAYYQNSSGHVLVASMQKTERTCYIPHEYYLAYLRSWPASHISPSNPALFTLGILPEVNPKNLHPDVSCAVSLSLAYCCSQGGPEYTYGSSYYNYTHLRPDISYAVPYAHQTGIAHGLENINHCVEPTITPPSSYPPQASTSDSSLSRGTVIVNVKEVAIQCSHLIAFRSVIWSLILRCGIETEIRTSSQRVSTCRRNVVVLG